MSATVEAGLAGRSAPALIFAANLNYVTRRSMPMPHWQAATRFLLPLDSKCATTPSIINVKYFQGKYHALQTAWL
jgi:hypothetical protein